MPGKLIVGLLQRRCAVDPQENLAATVLAIRDAAVRGAQIVCTQELFRSQYFCREEKSRPLRSCRIHSRPFHRSLRPARARAGHRHRGIALRAPRRRPVSQHRRRLDADGSLLGIYRKMHIPDDPLYYEKFYFAPGESGFPNFDTRYGRIGVLVCWDQWYPEGARLSSLRGANILFYPTAIGWHPAEKKNSAPHSLTPGERFSALTRLPMESLSPPLTASASKGLPKAVSNSGVLLRRRSFRPDARRSVAGQGRNSNRGVRPSPHGGGPPQLAVPA